MPLSVTDPSRVNLPAAVARTFVSLREKRPIPKVQPGTGASAYEEPPAAKQVG